MRILLEEARKRNEEGRFDEAEQALADIADRIVDMQSIVIREVRMKTVTVENPFPIHGML